MCIVLYSFRLPEPGKSSIINRCPFDPVNAETHMNGLRAIIQGNVADGKRVGVLIGDGGPDYNTNHAAKSFTRVSLERRS